MKFCKNNSTFKLFILIVCFLNVSMNVYASVEQPLTDDEYVMLMRYYSGVGKYIPQSEYLKYSSKEYNLFKKIIGVKNKKKSKSEVKIFVTFMSMAYSYLQPREGDLIADKLYESFALQPLDYFNAVSGYDDKRNAFCYYLGQSFNAYLYDENIKSDKFNQRELFLNKHSGDIESIGKKKYVDACVSKIHKNMPEPY